jgi:hypothetical protein
MEEDKRRAGNSSDTHIFQEFGILLVCNKRKKKSVRI